MEVEELLLIIMFSGKNTSADLVRNLYLEL
jgi:hypothetical protein